ncbi:hypothetical protein [Hydrocoleum sp. CS-953]|uniref:hypothetical protein n=1 Tax=Hydrocoleum sp. CS-953 TaxID=1671698 RepID=UPI001179D39B
MAENFMYRSGGENTFMPDTDDPQMPGKVGLQVVGGIVKHLGALTAIGCSTVNSYRRLWDTGFWAPVFADWGYLFGFILDSPFKRLLRLENGFPRSLIC